MYEITTLPKNDNITRKWDVFNLFAIISSLKKEERLKFYKEFIISILN